jgi:hypothetical protein
MLTPWRVELGSNIRRPVWYRKRSEIRPAINSAFVLISSNLFVGLGLFIHHHILIRSLRILVYLLLLVGADQFLETVMLTLLVFYRSLRSSPYPTIQSLDQFLRDLPDSGSLYRMVLIRVLGFQMGDQNRAK